MNKLTKLYILRHGESGGNSGASSDHVIGKGSTLTEKGKKQAKEAATELEKIQFDAVFSSDLARAEQTAEIIAQEKNIALETTERLRERSLGVYLKKNPGKNRDTVDQELIAALKDLDEAGKLSYKHSPDFESAEEGLTRLVTFLREIAVAYEGKTVLIVCHGNLIRTFLTHLGWAKYDELPSGAMKNTGYLVLESDGVDFFLKEVYKATKQANGKRGW